MDLGECIKIHDLALRADYETASKSKDYYYDIDVSILDNDPKYNFVMINTLYMSVCFVNS